MINHSNLSTINEIQQQAVHIISEFQQHASHLNFPPLEWTFIKEFDNPRLQYSDDNNKSIQVEEHEGTLHLTIYSENLLVVRSDAASKSSADCRRPGPATGKNNRNIYSAAKCYQRRVGSRPAEVQKRLKHHLVFHIQTGKHYAKDCIRCGYHFIVMRCWTNKGQGDMDLPNPKTSCRICGISFSVRLKLTSFVPMYRCTEAGQQT